MKFPKLFETARLRIASGAHPYPARLAQTARQLLLEQQLSWATQWGCRELVESDPVLRTRLRTERLSGLQADLFVDDWIAQSEFSVLIPVWLGQAAIVTFSSTWDWYVRRLAHFCCESLLEEGNTWKPLRRVPLREEIAWLDKACGGTAPAAAVSDVCECTLVRNLGVHNAWAVDEDYLRRSPNASRFVVDDIRLATHTEILGWMNALNVLFEHYEAVAGIRFSNSAIERT